jgi:hypothetical protein
MSLNFTLGNSPNSGGECFGQPSRINSTLAAAKPDVSALFEEGNFRADRNVPLQQIADMIVQVATIGN